MGSKRGKRTRSGQAGYGPVTDHDTHELAWAAGFFDGEGSVSLLKPGPDRYLPSIRCSISQKDRRVLDRFKAAVGFGGIYPNRRNGVCDLFVWNTGNRDLVHLVMWLLWPWLDAAKRDQFDRVCEQYKAAIH